MKKRINPKIFIKAAERVFETNQFSCWAVEDSVSIFTSNKRMGDYRYEYVEFYQNLFDFNKRIRDEGFNIYNVIEDDVEISYDDFQNFRVMLLLFAAEYIKTEKPIIEVK